jgi:hypothetical protein
MRKAFDELQKSQRAATLGASRKRGSDSWRGVRVDGVRRLYAFTRHVRRTAPHLPNSVLAKRDAYRRCLNFCGRGYIRGYGSNAVPREQADPIRLETYQGRQAEWLT